MKTGYTAPVSHNRHYIGITLLCTSVLMTYEEHQNWTGGDSHRLSSVLFVAKPDAPNGVGWFHLHEVWLPETQ